jgi:cytochrome b pre-mRNA-processing protein 3
MILKRFRENAEREQAARDLYAGVVTQARQSRFYAGHGVPDSLDGRFEMIALHAFLLLHRLKRDNPEAAPLSQAVYDVFFGDMDQCLREMGAGDLGVGRRVKRMAEGFAGRIAAYEEGMASADDGLLAEALRRNLFGTAPEVAEDDIRSMCRYLRVQDACLAEQDFRSLSVGNIDFAPFEAEGGAIDPPVPFP